MFPDIHGRTKFQHRLLILLTCIDSRCQLRIAEHIHHTVITDTVATAKIFMCIIIKHTPSKTSCDIRLPGNRIQHTCMAHRMPHTVFFPVIAFRRIHMSVIFADKIRFVIVRRNSTFLLASVVCSVVAEIIVCVNILQQTALFMCPYTPGLSCLIQFMCHAVCLPVKRIIIT